MPPKLLILSLALSCPFLAQAGALWPPEVTSSCLFGVYLGELHGSNDAEDRYFLGKGVTGKVFRVVPQDGGVPYVEKIYKTKTLWRNDREAFDFLASAILLPSPSKMPAGQDFRLVRREREERPKVMKFEDVRGVTVQDAYQAQQDPMTRKEIERKYEIALSRMHARVKARLAAKIGNAKASLNLLEDAHGGPFSTLSLTDFKGSDGERYDLLIKADNVILTPEGELVIIDPF